MRAFEFLAAMAALAGCGHHADKSDRDTKGRSTATIGPGTASSIVDASASAAVVDAGKLPSIAGQYVTLTWSGVIAQSTGKAPAAGTSCTLTTHAGLVTTSVPGDDALTLVCGAATLFDEQDAVDAPTRHLFRLKENPVAGEVYVFTYELLAFDKGPRTGRSQITIDTGTKGTIVVWRDTIPTFRATVNVLPKRDARRDLPLFPEQIPQFHVVSKTIATVVKSTGPLPFASKTCELRISPADQEHNCRVQLECAKKIVYGVTTSGFATCMIRGDAPVSMSDQKPTPVDGDPALTVDLDSMTATFADEPAGGAPFSVTFNLSK